MIKLLFLVAGIAFFGLSAQAQNVRAVPVVKALAVAPPVLSAPALVSAGSPAAFSSVPSILAQNAPIATPAVSLPVPAASANVLPRGASLDTITSIDPSVTSADRALALDDIFIAPARRKDLPESAVEGGLSAAPSHLVPFQSAAKGVQAPTIPMAGLIGATGTASSAGIAAAAIAGGLFGGALVGFIAYLRLSAKHPGNQWNALSAAPYALGGAVAGSLIGGYLGGTPQLAVIAGNAFVQIAAVSTMLAAATGAVTMWRRERSSPRNDWNKFYAIRNGAIAFVGSALVGTILALI